jgi:hypothetical protein
MVIWGTVKQDGIRDLYSSLRPLQTQMCLHFVVPTVSGLINVIK